MSSQMPNSNDIPSNSHKAPAETDKKDGRPEVTPFEGAVGGMKRKKENAAWAWIKKFIFNGKTPKEAFKQVVTEEIVPGFKDNMRNGVVSTLDMLIYPNAKPYSARTQNNSVSYNNVYRGGTAPKPQPQPQEEAKTFNEFENPTFRTRMDAESFLNGKMKAYDYPTLSVHTLYMMMRKHIDYTWDAYGWTQSEIASWDPMKIIVRLSGGGDMPWMINLPQAHQIS